MQIHTIFFRNIMEVDSEILKIVLNDKTFSRNESASIVGGLSRLYDLVGKGLIRAEKKSKRQNGRWACNAWDVVKYARIKK